VWQKIEKKRKTSKLRGKIVGPKGKIKGEHCGEKHTKTYFPNTNQGEKHQKKRKKEVQISGGEKMVWWML